MKSKKKRILVVSAKWPYVSNSTDGGDSTLNEIIRSLAREYLLDLFCFRNDIDIQSKIEGVNNIIFYQEDFAMFKNYSLHNEEKFNVRLIQAEIALNQIEKISHQYDLIVVQHVMFLLKMQNRYEILNKVILYPMFTGTSYLKCGENVSRKYFNAEKEVIGKVKMIITPSSTEKEMLINDYHVMHEKIVVIPRPIKFKYQLRQQQSVQVINLIYIASIRMQKDHLKAMKLVKLIMDKGVNVILNCVGAVQDKHIYEECIDFLENNKIEGNVIFHGNKSNEELGKLIDKCDFNISVSRWETFGRGIYEGMTAGLPTIVLDSLECITNAHDINIYPCVVKNIEEMAEKVIEMIESESYYKDESKKGELLEKKLGEEIICKKTYIQFKGML